MKIFILNWVISGTVLLSIAACSPKPPHSAQNPPTYPNAQHQVIQTITTGMDPELLITFRTSDTPDAIFAFYTNALLKDGWQLRDYLATPDERHFGWITADPGTPAYDFAIFTTSGGKGLVNVEIYVITEIPK